MSQPSQPTDYQRLFWALLESFLLLCSDGTVVDNSDAHVATSLLPRLLQANE